MILSLALVIGYRPLSIGSDTLGYVAYYNSLVTKLLLNSYFEYLFDFIARVIAYLDLPYNFFFYGSGPNIKRFDYVLGLKII